MSNQSTEYYYLRFEGEVPDLGVALRTDIHFYGHHKAYENAYNGAIQQHEDLKHLSPSQVSEILWDEMCKGKISEARRKIFRNCEQARHHNLFWKSLSTLYDSDVETPLHKDDFVETGMKQFGSGWLWIVKIDDKLDMCTTSNEESVRFHTGSLYAHLSKALIAQDAIVLGVIDLWEHAYYLDYYQDRRNYLSEIYEKINWKRIMCLAGMQDEQTECHNSLYEDEYDSGVELKSDDDDE